jgi:hypothetical protein
MRVVLALLLFALPAAAQVRPRGAPPLPRPDSARRDSATARRDSIRRDSIAAAARRDTTRARQVVDTARVDSAAVTWPAADSVMAALLARPGYDVTRFQGARVTYDAVSKDLRLDASKAQKAAVDRNGQVMVSDSTIFYNQASSTTTNEGCYVLNLPGSTEAPIRGCGTVTYNAANRTSQFTKANVPFNNGEYWLLYLDAGAAEIDTTEAGKGSATIWGRSGRITSCPDSVPDYYFSSKTIKRTKNGTVIARDVVLYIGDVPTLWLPFIFQNVRTGRVSGLLTTRFGLSDIVRNSPTYHRNIENFGYYWAMSDYMDATAWLDWRSGGGGTNAADPGWLKLNGRWDYNWLGRFLSGSIAANYWFMGNGDRNLGLSWGHAQQFSNDGNLRLDINYVADTRVQRQNTFDPYQQLATISSQASYSRKIGPASLSIGGNRRQYPGRPQVDQTFPTFQVSTVPIKVGEYLTWTPTFSYTASASLNLDQPSIFQVRYGPGGVVDSIKRSMYSSVMSFNSPLKIFGWDFTNSFNLRSTRQKFPELVKIYDVTSGDSIDTRVFQEIYQTDIDWTPTFALPSIGQNRWNFAPGFSIANVDPGAFWVSSERTNGRFVRQAKRPTFTLSATPTVYGLFRGFGPFAALRHTITPSMGYSYAPAKAVSDDYLLATRRSRKGYLGSLRINAVNFGLNTSVEAKMAGDSARGGGTKMKVLALSMTPFSYNFERLNAPEVTSTKWWRGLTTERFSYTVTSDLLPGVQLTSDYSLFQGSTTSDTAVFSPYRVSTSASLTLSRDANPLAVIMKLFGKAVPAAQHAPVVPTDPSITPDQQAQARELAGQPVAGSRTAGERFVTPPSGGWRLALTLSSQRQRPPKGGTVIATDAETRCLPLANGDPFVYEACIARERLTPTQVQGFDVPGAPVYLYPATMNIGANLGFNLTPRWSVTWNTNYDAQRHEFAMHTVGLQRDLHDWRAIFGFTQSPNGNFAFNFSIGLKAQPDLKFDYARNSIRSQTGGF